MSRCASFVCLFVCNENRENLTSTSLVPDLLLPRTHLKCNLHDRGPASNDSTGLEIMSISVVFIRNELDKTKESRFFQITTRQAGQTTRPHSASISFEQTQTARAQECRLFHSASISPKWERRFFGGFEEVCQQNECIPLRVETLQLVKVRIVVLVLTWKWKGTPPVISINHLYPRACAG